MKKLTNKTKGIIDGTKTGQGMNMWLSLLPPHNKRAIAFHACSVTGIAFGINYL